MAKDPAVLWYTSDFYLGTMFFSDEQVGKYTRILVMQHQQGHLSEQDMLKICKRYDEKIFEKFKKDKEGKYYNERMEIEIIKRRNYSESRKKNRENKEDMTNISGTYDKHMVNINEDININEEKIVQSSDEPTMEDVTHYFDSNGFDIKHGENFYSYYSAQNWETKSGVSIKKNWQRKVIGWMNNQKQFNNNNGTSKKEEPIKNKKRFGNSQIMNELYGGENGH